MNRVSKDVLKEVLDIYVYKIFVFWKLKIRFILFSLFLFIKNIFFIVKKKYFYFNFFLFYDFFCDGWKLILWIF